MTDRKLKKEAQIGSTIFHVVVSERIVIKRAQREYEYQNSPEKLAERKAVRDLTDEVRVLLRKRKRPVRDKSPAANESP